MKTTVEKGFDPSLIACPSRWTLLPFCREIGRNSRYSIRMDSPGSVSSLLGAQDVELAFCGPEALLKNLDFELAAPIGEVAEGGAGLVYFTSTHQEKLNHAIEERLTLIEPVFAKVRLDQPSDDLVSKITELCQEVDQLLLANPLEPVTVDLLHCPGSFGALGGLVYRILFGFPAFETNELLQRIPRSGPSRKDGSIRIEVRCGNDALIRASQARGGIDVLQIWERLTKLPFVASVLQRSRKQIPLGGRLKLVELSERAQAKMRVEPSAYLPDIKPENSLGQEIDLPQLWKNVSYRLTSEHFQSLLVFLYFMRPLQKSNLDDASFRIKVIRWQQREQAIM